MLVDIDQIIVKDRILRNNRGIRELAEDIRNVGMLVPIVVNKDYELLDGYRRYRACKTLGWPVIDICFASSSSILNSTNNVAKSGLQRRKKWSVQTVRKMLENPADLIREPCFICGQHESIAVLHHVVQVSELTKMLNVGLIEPNEVNTPVVWLCPNCHAYVHAAIRSGADALSDICADSEWWECFRSVIKARTHHIEKLTGKGV